MTIPIPPGIRAALYWVSAIVGVGLGGLAIWYQFTPDGAPSWLDTVTKLLLFLAAAFGITSATNTLPTPDQTALPAIVRKVIYWIVFAASVVVGALVVVLGAGPGEAPTWVEALSAIVVFVGGAFGFTAASHVVPSPPPGDVAQPEA
jgi:hypothetical protein